MIGAAHSVTSSLFVRSAFTDAECERILTEETTLPSRQGLVYTAQGTGLVQRETYDCEERFPDAPWILGRLTTLLVEASSLVDRITILREKPRLLHYRVGGHFIWHQDAVAGTLLGTPPRVLTGIIHLNDGFAGGEVDVETEQASRARGVATLFPAVCRHRLRPVTKGERWALVFWGYA